MAADASHFLDYQPDDLDVRVAELIVGTHDAGDPLVHPKVSEALSSMREHMNMDVVFVSQFGNGRRTFRVVDDARHVKTIFTGHSDPLEESWCHYVAEGRVPQFIKDARPLVASGQVPNPQMDIGTHMSTPIKLRNGEVFGTLCCFSCEVEQDAHEVDMERLRYAAKLIAEELHHAGVGRDLELQPVAPAPARSRF